MLYYFNTEEESRAFFSGNLNGNDTATARIQIDLTTVGSVRVSAKRSLPGGGRGIELHTPSRVWLLVPRSETEFASWLRALSGIVSHNLHRLAQLTGDDELRRDVGDVELTSLSSQALSLLKTGAGAGEMMYAAEGVVGEAGSFGHPEAGTSIGLSLIHI